MLGIEEKIRKEMDTAKFYKQRNSTSKTCGLWALRAVMECAV